MGDSEQENMEMNQDAIQVPLPSERVPRDSNRSNKHMIITVNRPVYTQAQFDEVIEPSAKHRKTARERVDDFKSKSECSASCAKKGAVYVFPFLRILQGYSMKDDFVNDLIAGLTVGIMHIPQGMAYGMLTNLPPIYGLYTSFFPVMFYFFLGQSRHISLGTFAVVSLMTGVVVDKVDCSSSSNHTSDASHTTMLPPQAYTDDARGYDNMSTTSSPSPAGGFNGMSQEELMCKVGYVMALNFTVGVYQLLMGLFRLGFVTIYMSEPLTRAFTTASAVYVLTSQIKHIFGISTGKYPGALKLVYTYIDFFSNITSTNIASLVMGCICMLLIYLTKEFINPKVKAKIKMPFPIELLMIIIGTIISYFAQFEERFSMKVVGDIPYGIPPPAAPPFSRIPDIATDAIGIAIVAFAVNVSMGQLFAKKHSYEMPANSELVAYGTTNMAGSFLNCYTSAASLSRSLIQEAVGGRTQVTGLISCCLLVVVLYGVGPLFEQLPNTVLAAIVLVNLKGMFLQFKDLKKLWMISKYDFLIWLVTFLAVCIIDVDLGLFCGIGFSLLTVVFRTQSPYTCLMGRVPHTDIYKDLSVYKTSEEITGIKIFRFESSLYYANVDHFVDKIFHKCLLNPRKLRAKQVKMERKRKSYKAAEEKKAKKMEKAANVEAATNKQMQNGNLRTGPTEEDLDQMYPLPTSPVESIIIDCSAMSYLDSVGVSTLGQVIEEFKEVNVEVTLAGCKAGVREMLQKAGFFNKINADHLFPSIHDAVLIALRGNPSLRKKLQEDVATLSRGISLFNVVDVKHMDDLGQLIEEDQNTEVHSPLLEGASAL